MTLSSKDKGEPGPTDCQPPGQAWPSHSQGSPHPPDPLPPLLLPCLIGSGLLPAMRREWGWQVGSLPHPLAQKYQKNRLKIETCILPPLPLNCFPIWALFRPSSNAPLWEAAGGWRCAAELGGGCSCTGGHGPLQSQLLAVGSGWADPPHARSGTQELGRAAAGTVHEAQGVEGATAVIPARWGAHGSCDATRCPGARWERHLPGSWPLSGSRLRTSKLVSPQQLPAQIPSAPPHSPWP